MLLKLVILTTAVLTVTAQRNLTPFGTAYQSSEYGNGGGTAANAVKSPISNQFKWKYCTHTHPNKEPAWWMFKFDFDMTYITNILIYYRKGFANRMRGFKLYVSNTTSIPPKGYLCYEDPVNDTDLPNITQSIPCNQLGKYVIYYDDTGSFHPNDSNVLVYSNPIIELCYVAITGCPKNFWGRTCSQNCSENCIDQHCFPENGSCVWGCYCLDGICNANTSACIGGCMDNRTGIDCNKYNLATDGVVLQESSSSQSASQVNDGNFSSCFHLQGKKSWLQIDIKKRSTVTEIFIVFRANTTQEGIHTIYASHTNGSSENATILKQFESSEMTEIMVKPNAVFRYLFYKPPGQDHAVDVCEIGIVGCPPSQFGPLCTNVCPVNCSGPCDLTTGYCIYGCLNEWIGDTCELDPKCFKHAANNYVATCKPEIYKVYPLSGPVNGGTLVSITGQFIGNANDIIFVDFDGIRCKSVIVQKPHTSLTCVTGESNATVKTIYVLVNGNKSQSSSLSFSYKHPTISDFTPKNGIKSGNTTVTIIGQNISFEGQHRYNISFYNERTRVECRVFQNTFSSNTIKCKTGKSDVSQNMSQLQVVIDNMTILMLNRTFQYLPDPKFTLSNESRKAQQSGGATFTISGQGFNNVGEITVDRVEKPCDVPEDTSAVCETPTKLANQSNSQTVYVRFDGVTLPVTIDYVDDPTFEKFQDVYAYDKESSIEIKGKNILNGARFDDYNIQVGLDGKCLISDITMDFIKCVPPKNVPRTNKSDVNTVHVKVVVGKITAYIGDLQYKEDDNQFSLIIGLLTGGLVTSIIIGFTAVFISRRSKKRFMVKCKMEMTKALSERRENSGNNDELRDIEGNEMAYSEINPAVEFNSNTNSISHQDVHNVYEKLGPCSPTNPYNCLQQSATDNQIPDKEIGNNDELKRIEGNEMAYSEINPAAELNSNTNSKGHQEVHNEYEKLGPCSPTNPYNWLQQSATDNQKADKEIGNNDELKRIEGNEMAYNDINPAAQLNTSSNTNSIGRFNTESKH
ncbi:uncharacterized protein LOC143061509 [Mytilus galloprovincialis]|uniref:uncharacterized protein LOC143061509 n=1 Tax=Mytilus galloprovincialis TaxID=29158 RepID=UPI003F7BA39D